MGILSRALQRYLMRAEQRSLPSSTQATLQSQIIPEYEVDGVLGALRAPRELSWWWGRPSDAGWGKDIPKNIARRDVAETFNSAADTAGDYVLSRFPRQYVINPLTEGHARRYGRDLERGLSGTGYRITERPGEAGASMFSIDPTLEAYLRYMAMRLRPAASAGLLSAAAWNEPRSESAP